MVLTSAAGQPSFPGGEALKKGAAMWMTRTVLVHETEKAAAKRRGLRAMSALLPLTAVVPGGERAFLLYRKGDLR